MKRFRIGPFGLMFAMGLLALPSVSAADDKVKLSFAFLGCNRIQHSDWKGIKKDDPSSANLPQLTQTFTDIAALKHMPSHLFFTGDLVVNLEDDDGTKLKHQLEAWTDVYKDSPVHKKLTLVPFPGNHEMLQKLKEDKDDEVDEVPNPACGPVFVKWLKKSGFNTYAKLANGPKKGDPKDDHLVDDQSELTYSFDIGDIHFVVINTDTLSSVIDPKTKHPYAAWVPYNWIAKDVQAAQANKKISAIFLLGHKPIQALPKREEDTVLNENGHMLADQLIALFAANSKVRAYLCAHEHMWDCRAFDKAPKAYQVIAGNGGSQLAKHWVKDLKPAKPYYGFSQINVYESGKVGLISYQRPVPKVYFQGPSVPATPQPEQILFGGP